MKNSSIINNSIWGILSNITQSVILTLYFILIARYACVQEFSTFIIANSLYQLFSGIAPIGLMHYVVREINSNKKDFSTIKNFFIVEVLLGFLFLSLFLTISTILYSNTILFYCVLLSLNIVVDNIIYYYKSINIGISKQFNNAKVTLFESILKLLSTILLITLKCDLSAIILSNIIIRIASLIYIDRITEENFKVKNIFKTKTSFNIKHFTTTIKKGSYFILISSLSIVFWKINTLILSKISSLNEVSLFEVSLKLFSIIQIIPVIYLVSIYPKLSKEYLTSKKRFEMIYRNSFILLLIYSIICISLFNSFGEWGIKSLFGEKYTSSFNTAKIMVLTIAPMSLVLLQAYVLLSTRNEKLDMLLNLLNLTSTILISIFIIPYYGSIGASISLFISFSIFYILQEIIIINKKIILNYKLFLLSIITLLPMILSIIYFDNTKHLPLLYCTIVLFIFRKQLLRSINFFKQI